MKYIEKCLIFEDRIIEGDVMREIIDYFPNTQDSFKQRKSYDEYYYEDTVVKVKIQDIHELTTNGYKVEINYGDIKLTF